MIEGEVQAIWRLVVLLFKLSLWDIITVEDDERFRKEDSIKDIWRRRDRQWVLRLLGLNRERRRM